MSRQDRIKVQLTCRPFQWYLKCKQWTFSPSLGHVVNEFFGDNDVVCCLGIQNEGSLVGGDKIRQLWSEPSHKNFCNDFLSHITQGLGRDSFSLSAPSCLGINTIVGQIQLRWPRDVILVKEVCHEFHQIMVGGCPNMIEKTGVETIRPRGL